MFNHEQRMINPTQIFDLPKKYNSMFYKKHLTKLQPFPTVLTNTLINITDLLIKVNILLLLSLSLGILR